MSPSKPVIPAFFSRSLFPMCIMICTFVASLRFIIASPIQSDSYTHLAAGQYMFLHHRIPTHEDLSYKDTQPSLEWIDHNWVSDIVLYLAGSKHMTFGAIILVWSMLMVTAVLLLRILHALRVPLSIASITTTFSVLLVLPYWRFHPIIFSLPLIAGIMLLFFLWFSGRRHALWYLPVLFFLFANISGGFIAIPFILSLLLLIVSPSVLKAKQVITGIAALILSILSSLLNPFGFRIYVYTMTVIWSIFKRSIFFSLPAMLKYTNQTISKQLPVSIFHTIFTFYLVILLVALLYFFIRHVPLFRKHVLILLPCFFLVLLATVWVRFLPYAAIGIAPLAGVLFFELTSSLSVWKKYVCIGVFGAGAAAFALFIFITLPTYFPFDPPLKQIALIREWNLPDNLFTSYDITGYALYSFPDTRVLLDAQDDLYDELETMAFITASGVPSQKLTQITDQNSINTMLVSMDIGGLALAANADPDWALVYVETNGLLFVRRSQMPEAFLSTHELKTIDLSRNLGFDPEKKNAAITELLQYIERFPEAVLAKGQLATLYRMGNQLDKAEAILMSIPETRRTFVVKTELGRTMAAQGKCKDSEYWLLSALKERNERNFARATLDLGILYAACFGDKKKAQHYFARFNSYILHPAEREYLRQVSAQFGITLDEQ